MHKFIKQTRNKLGFSMVELMIVIAILSIMASIAIPGFSRWLPNYQLRRASRDLLSAFQLAKMEAIRKNTRCSLTFNQTIGAETYAYVVYMDPNVGGNTPLQYDAAFDTIIKQIDLNDYKNVSFDNTQGNGDGLDGDGLLNFPIINGRPSISFRPNGLPADAAGQPASGGVFLNNINNNTSNITLNAGGAVQIN